MSGRKQHYLPQFLQRNFAHRVAKPNFYVHVHERRAKYSPSTNGVGAVRDFYSTQEDTSADDNITESESSLGLVLNQIMSTRSLPSGSDVPSLFAALSIRTLKVRSAMQKLAPEMIAALRERSMEQANVLDVIDEQMNDSAWLNAQVDKVLLPLGRLDRNKRAGLAALLVRKVKVDLEKQRPAIVEQFNIQANLFFDQLESQAADAANRGLSRFFSDPASLGKRSAFFDDFDYKLLESGSEKFILGDCAVGALDSSLIPRLAIGNIDKNVTLDQVFLPVSPELLIHGTKGCNGLLTSSSEINKLLAKLSHKFFISQEAESPHIDELKTLIGTAESPILNLEELDGF